MGGEEGIYSQVECKKCEFVAKLGRLLRNDSVKGDDGSRYGIGKRLGGLGMNMKI